MKGADLGKRRNVKFGRIVLRYNFFFLFHVFEFKSLCENKNTDNILNPGLFLSYFFILFVYLMLWYTNKKFLFVYLDICYINQKFLFVYLSIGYTNKKVGFVYLNIGYTNKKFFLR